MSRMWKTQWPPRWTAWFASFCAWRTPTLTCKTKSVVAPQAFDQPTSISAWLHLRTPMIRLEARNSVWRYSKLRMLFCHWYVLIRTSIYFDYGNFQIGTLSQTIVKTLQKWVRYEKIEEDELVRKIFALLYRQYDAIGEVHIWLPTRNWNYILKTIENKIKDL